jgi:hypothetical protein
MLVHLVKNVKLVPKLTQNVFYQCVVFQGSILNHGLKKLLRSSDLTIHCLRQM